MKKKITITSFAMLAAAILMVIAPTSVYANSTDNTVTVIVDGRTIDFPDAPAFVDENGRTQMPARFIGEALGARVTWDATTSVVLVSRQGTVDNRLETVALQFTIGSTQYRVRTGAATSPFQNHSMDTAAVIYEDRTYVPVRFLAEGLGATVVWDAPTRTVNITSESVSISGFDIPDSHNCSVSVNIEGTLFSLRLNDPVTFDNPENYRRMQSTLNILSQRLHDDSIQSIESFFRSNLEFDYEGYNIYGIRNLFGEYVANAYGITFRDQSTLQYIRVARSRQASSNFFRVIVYPLNVVPEGSLR